MSEKFPDLEIYVLKAEPEQVQQWLSSLFSQVSVIKSTDQSTLWQVDEMQVQFSLHVQAKFSSIWFKSNHTDWPNDLECARSAHKFLQLEIRCSSAGWQEQEEKESVTNDWVKLIRGEEKPLNWT